MKINPIRPILYILRWLTATRRRKILSSILTILIVLTSMRFIFIKTPEVEAAWWDDNWHYRKRIEFGNSGAADSNKKVQFDVDTATPITEGKMQSSCQDVRFTDANGKLLRHHLDAAGGGGGGPTNIDNASDFGVMVGSARQVVRTSGGVLYAVLNDGGSCEVWRSTDGTSWTEQDSGRACIGGGALTVAIDSANDLHIAYTLDAFGDEGFKYVKFTTSDNQFSTSETIIGPGSGTGTGAISIKVDSNDVPHVAYDFFNGTSSNLEYSNRVSGVTAFAWNKTPVALESLIAPGIDITINEDNIAEISYINPTDDDLTAAVGNVNDATSFTLQDVDTDINNVGNEQGTSIAVDSSGNTWIAYVDNDVGGAGNDYISLVKHNDGDAWSTWQTPVHNSNLGYEPSIAIDGSDIYVFYQEDSTDTKIVYDKYDGSSWLGETTLQTPGGGVDFRDAKARWSFLNNPSYTTYGIDYLYSDGTDVFWANLAIGGQGCNNASTDYWVLVENINSGDTVIYLYYSNPSAADTGESSQFPEATFSPTSGPTTSSEEIGPSPAMYLKFDEGVDNTCSGGTNDACDSTSNANDGAISGGTAWQTEDMCISGKCLWFDQTDDVVTVANADSIDFDLGLNDAFTFQAWVRVNSDGENDTGEIFDKGSHLYMRVDSDGSDGLADLEVFVDLATTDPTVNIVNGITLNRWHHVAAAYTDDADDDISVYIDGILVGTGDGSGAPAGTDTSDLLIGGDSSNNFHGFIDEVKVYNEERTAVQIKADFQKISGLHGASASFGDDKSFLSDGLSGYWKLDESSGNASDSSGNENTLTNNATTTFVGGKFGNGSEHVPASSQYFSGPTSSSTYYFDASDAGPSDPNSVWTTDSNAFNGSTSNFADTNSNGNTSANYLLGEGTNAPATGNTITSVEARIYGEADDDTGQPEVFATIYTNGKSQSLGTPFVDVTPDAWGSYLTLTTPTGGWTWSKIQTLEVFIYAEGLETSPTAHAHRVEVRVNTTSLSNLESTKSISFWVNPDATTNYYISLTSSAYITSSSGTLSATGFTNPKIYVNGVATAAISADSWQLVTVTTDTEIDANQFYIGRQGSNYFDGTMDEVRLYNRSFSPNDVAKLYTFGPGPIVHFPFDENTGTSTVYDRSGVNNYTGTMNGNMTESDWVSGKLGSGLDFDDVDDYVEIGSDIQADDSTQGTITAWVYPKGIGGAGDHETIFSYGGGAAGNAGLFKFTIGTAGGNNNIAIEQNNDGEATRDRVRGNTTLSANNWYHVAVTSDGSNYALYVNGIEEILTVNQGSNVGDWIGDTTVSATIQSVIGVEYENGSLGDYFDGIVDDLKIYNYPRNQEQIVEDMNAGHPAPGSPIGSAVAHWKFDEGYGTTANDQTSNDNDLTLNTASWTNSGKFGKAFNGTGGAIRMSRSTDPDLEFSATDDFSISTWFKSDSASDPAAIEYLVANGPTSAAGYAIYANTDGTICFGIDDDATWGPDVASCTADDFYDGNWHHILAVRDYSAFDSTYLYIDGIQRDSDTDTTTATLDSNSTFFVADIDTDDAGSGEEFAGDIDELKVYRFALTSQQVKAEYNQSSAAVWGATSTDSSDVASWSAANEYCPPGQGSACTAPIGHWSFDENTGTSTVYDRSGNGNNGTMNGSMTEDDWVPGRFGSALDFDGSNDEINGSPQIISDYPFTASARVKTTDTDGVIFELGDADDTSWQTIRLQTGNASAVSKESLNGIVAAATSTTNISDGLWHHVTGVFFSDNERRVYVDGQLEDTDTNSRNYDATIDNWCIANECNNNSSSDLLTATIDEVKVYNYARTQAQIAWEYNRGGPVGWWKFDDCGGTTAYDASGNGNDGTIDANTTGDNTSEGTCSSGAGNEMWDNGTVGKRNASLDFDGTNDVVTVTNSTLFDFGTDIDFSLSGWFNITSDGQDDDLFDAGVDVTGTFRVHYDDANSWIEATIRDGLGNGCRVESSIDIADDKWHHVDVVFLRNASCSTSDILIYIDGLLDSATNGITTSNTNVDIDVGNFEVSEDGSSSRTINGKADDIRIFNYALTEQQIKGIVSEGAVRFGPNEGSP